MNEKELSAEEWKQEKKRKRMRFTALQNQPYEVKVRRAERRAIEFVEKLDDLDMEAHVSVGGLDSITLLIFLRRIGIDVPAVSVSSLEDKSIQKIHRELGVIPIRPGKSKVEIINEFGFPVVSKKIAGKIDTLQNPTEKNKTVRHAIITGECGAQGHYAKDSRMKMPKKWLELFAGYENENEGVNYKIAPFKVSNKCCQYMKEEPCDKWAKEHHSAPFLGLMASEGGQREENLVEHGCNDFGKSYIQPEPREPDAVCAGLESIWRKDRIGLTGSGSVMRKNGSFGCISAVRIRRPGKSMDGAESWTISESSGKTGMWTGKSSR